MEIRTKYDLEDNLYFFHKGKVRYGVPEVIELSLVSTVDESTIVVTYCFVVQKGKPLVEKAQNEVFKRRADLIKSLL